MIPPGQYGAGAVLVWDRGPYRNLTTDDGKKVPMNQAIANGHLAVWLEGNKLRGGFALTQMDRNERDQDEWLFVKMDEGS